MSKLSVDYELVAGLFAVQQGELSEDELVSILRECGRTRTLPSVAIRSTHGQLQNGSWQELAARAESEIASGGFDEVLEQLSANVGPALRSAIQEYLAAPLGTIDPMAATLSHSESLDAGLFRFAKVNFHDRGGLGEIWIARDREVPRHVALKEIQPHRADDPEAQRKFLNEAKITGWLEHPGVVPVYGLGTYPDGRPFYAMRFIRGTSMKTAIDAFHGQRRGETTFGERRLALRRLLQHLISVCNTMEFAHSRQIIHRDLKPSNIMLGDYGETLIVDWGLAKRLPTDRRYDSAFYEADVAIPDELTTDHGETYAGAIVGTPGYLPPEQARGQTMQVGPASDIFSLGATLYHIMTGRAPYADENALESARNVVFAPPRQINRRVSPALQAICLKAMAAQPADRYQSARAMAQDLERWLADEPVLAYEESWHQRLARLMRRHKRWTISIGTSLLFITVASLLMALVIDNARRGERRSKQKATELLTIARGSADELLVGVSDELERMGADPVRERLLEAAAEAYTRFVSIETNDPGLRAEMAASNTKLGEVYIILDRSSDALAPLKRAVDQFRALNRQRPSNDNYRLGLAKALTQTGRALNLLGRLDESIRAHRQSLQLLENGSDAEFTNSPEAISTRANVRVNLAVSLTDQQHWEAADESYRAAIADLKSLVRAGRDIGDERELETKARTARAYLNLGAMLAKMPAEAPELGNTSEAYFAALSYTNELLRANQRHPRYRELQGLCYNNLGDYYLQHDATRAAENFTRAIDVYSSLERQNPEKVSYRLDRITARIGLAAAHNDNGAVEEAWKHLEQAVSESEALVAEYADNPYVPLVAADALYHLAEQQQNEGKYVEAADLVRRAIDLKSEAIPQIASRDHDAEKEKLSDFYNRLMIVLLNHLRDPHAALIEIHKMRNNQALEANASNPHFRNRLGMYCGESYVQLLSNNEEAAAFECKSIALQYMDEDEFQRILREIQAPPTEAAP